MRYTTKKHRLYEADDVPSIFRKLAGNDGIVKNKSAAPRAISAEDRRRQAVKMAREAGDMRYFQPIIDYFSKYLRNFHFANSENQAELNLPNSARNQYYMIDDDLNVSLYSGTHITFGTDISANALNLENQVGLATKINIINVSAKQLCFGNLTMTELPSWLPESIKVEEFILLNCPNLETLETAPKISPMTKLGIIGCDRILQNTADYIKGKTNFSILKSYMDRCGLRGEAIYKPRTKDSFDTFHSGSDLTVEDIESLFSRNTSVVLANESLNSQSNYINYLIESRVSRGRKYSGVLNELDWRTYQSAYEKQMKNLNAPRIEPGKLKQTPGFEKEYDAYMKRHDRAMSFRKAANNAFNRQNGYGLKNVPYGDDTDDDMKMDKDEYYGGGNQYTGDLTDPFVTQSCSSKDEDNRKTISRQETYSRDGQRQITYDKSKDVKRGDYSNDVGPDEKTSSWNPALKYKQMKGDKEVRDYFQGKSKYKNGKWH
jgi:hypothetical protein